MHENVQERSLAIMKGALDDEGVSCKTLGLKIIFVRVTVPNWLTPVIRTDVHKNQAALPSLTLLSPIVV